MSEQYISGLLISEPNDELLALSGDGVTPSENLSKFSSDKDSESTKVDFDTLVNSSSSTPKIPIKKQIAQLSKQTDTASKTKLAELQKQETARLAAVSADIRKHPDIKQYTKQDQVAALEEWDELADKHYTECRAVDGTVKRVSGGKQLQEQVDELSSRYGITFKNPRVQDSLDTAKTKRLLKQKSGAEFKGFYGTSDNQRQIRNVTAGQVDQTLASGSIDTITSVVDVLGKHYIRNKHKNAGTSFLSGYVKDPLSRFNNSEFKKMDDLMESIDPTWGGYISGGVTTYKRSNFKSLSSDAVKLLGYGDSTHRLLSKVAKLTKFDRKMDAKIRKVKKRSSSGSYGGGSSVYS